MKSLVIGASAGLGRALAEALAARGHALFLVASDETDLVPLASDLMLRFGIDVSVRAENLASADPEGLREDVMARLGGVDNLFYVAGESSLDDSGCIADAMANRLMSVNFSAGVRIVNTFLGIMENNPAANFVGIGSVAACRGRRNNSIYGAAKRGLEFYFETVRHHLARHHCRVQFYRLGYLETQMTLGQDLRFPAMAPAAAAQKICDNLGKDLGVVYLPRWWFGITSILQLLPWHIFCRLDI